MNKNRIRHPLTAEEFQENLASEMNNQKETKDFYDEAEKEVKSAIQEYQAFMDSAMNNPFIVESLKHSNLRIDQLTFEVDSTSLYEPDGEKHVYLAYPGKYKCLRIIVEGERPFKALAFKFNPEACSKECKHG